MGQDTDERERNGQGRYADRIPPESVLDVFDAREDRARPLTASDVVDELEIARRTAHNKLNALVERGVLDTRKVGARGRVWWTPDRRDETVADGELRGSAETTLDDSEPVERIPNDDPTESTVESGHTPGVTSSGSQADQSDATGATPPESDLGAVVEDVAEGWDDTGDRLEARKAAARAVLEYAREHGGVSKQEAKEEIEPEHPVDGQNPRTWYRKNVRPALNQAAEYNQSTRQYELVTGEGGDT